MYIVNSEYNSGDSKNPVVGTPASILRSKEGMLPSLTQKDRLITLPNLSGRLGAKALPAT